MEVSAKRRWLGFWGGVFSFFFNFSGRKKKLVESLQPGSAGSAPGVQQEVGEHCAARREEIKQDLEKRIWGRGKPREENMRKEMEKKRKEGALLPLTVAKMPRVPSVPAPACSRRTKQGAQSQLNHERKTTAT